MAVIARSSVITLFGHLALFLTIGFANSSGVLYNEWSSYFEDDPKEALALATALNGGLYLGAGPLAAVICESFSCRFSLILGAVLTFVGAMGASFSQSAAHLALSFGLAMGIGEALILVPTIALVVRYNPKNTRRAITIVNVGVGVGVIVIPMSYEAVSKEYSWRGCLLIYSAVLLNLLAFPALNLQVTSPEIELEMSSAEEPSTVTVRRRTTLQQKVMYFVRCPEVYLHFFSEISWVLSAGVVMILGPKFANSAANADPLLMVSYYGCGSLIGRVLIFMSGCMPLCRKVPSWFLFIFATALSIVPTAIYPFGTSDIYFSCCNIILGVFYGIEVCCQSPMYAEFFASDLLVVVIGISFCFCGVGFLIGPPFVIAVSNATGRPEHVFYISAAFYMISALCTTCVAYIRRRRNKETEEKSVVKKLLT